MCNRCEYSSGREWLDFVVVNHEDESVKIVGNNYKYNYCEYGSGTENELTQHVVRWNFISKVRKQLANIKKIQFWRCSKNVRHNLKTCLEGFMKNCNDGNQKMSSQENDK